MQVTICQKYLHSSVVNLVILIYLRFCHKLTIVAIYAFSRYNFAPKKFSNAKVLTKHHELATIYATRYPTRYPDLFPLPYPNPTRSQKALPVTAC